MRSLANKDIYEVPHLLTLVPARIVFLHLSFQPEITTSKSKCCFDCMFSVSESLDCSVHRLNATYLLSGHDNAVDVSAAGQKSLRSDGCFLSLTFFARAVCPFDVGRSARAHKRHGKVLIPREMQHSVEPMWEIGKCINMTVARIVHIRDDQRRVRPKSN